MMPTPTDIPNANGIDSGTMIGSVSRTASGIEAITSGNPGAPRADKQQESADHAMELLNDAITADYNKADSMAQDPDLDPIRERDDFKKLLAEMSEKHPPTDKAKRP